MLSLGDSDNWHITVIMTGSKEPLLSILENWIGMKSRSTQKALVLVECFSSLFDCGVKLPQIPDKYNACAEVIVAY